MGATVHLRIDGEDKAMRVRGFLGFSWSIPKRPC